MRARLGQHFLKNTSKIRGIIDALNLKNGDTVIEVGAGGGELTKEIIARLQDFKIARLIAIEKDKNLYRDLIAKFQDCKIAKFIYGDALKIISGSSKFYFLDSRFYKIVGNIPYYITGQLLRTLGELEPKPEVIVLTIQKEVALRICAKPKKMNLLAASVQFWAEPKIVDYISKKDFYPAPEVDSAIIKLTPRSTINDYLVTNDYYKLLKVLFKQPRKTILNNLLRAFSKEKTSGALQKLKIKPDLRSQNLNIEEIERLSEFLYNKNNES